MRHLVLAGICLGASCAARVVAPCAETTCETTAVGHAVTWDQLRCGTTESVSATWDAQSATAQYESDDPWYEEGEIEIAGNLLRFDPATGSLVVTWETDVPPAESTPEPQVCLLPWTPGYLTDAVKRLR